MTAAQDLGFLESSRGEKEGLADLRLVLREQAGPKGDTGRHRCAGPGKR